MIAPNSPFRREHLVRWIVRVSLSVSCLLILITLLVFARGIGRADEARGLLSDSLSEELEGMMSGKYSDIEFVRVIEDGIRTETWPNGWKHVYPDGEWWNGKTSKKVYDPHGTLRRESVLIYGVTDGSTTLWNESGRLLGWGHLVRNRSVGIWFIWNRSMVPYAVVL